MRRLRPIVRKFPGPFSYCSCERLCSKLTLEHVVPKKFLKDNLRKEHINRAVVDPHNLTRCCSRLNSAKSHHLLGDHPQSTYDDFHNSYLSRISLYMLEKYDLSVPDDLYTKWKWMNLKHEPFIFEKERNQQIVKLQGDSNIYITNYPNIFK